MLRFLDSCNHYNSLDLHLKWNIDTVDGTGATPTIVPSGRFGGNAIQITPGGQGISKKFDDQQIWIVGFNFRTTSFGNGEQNLLLFYNGDNFKVSMGTSSGGNVWFNPTGTNYSSSFQMQVNTWYYIETQIYIGSSIIANSCMINIDGHNVLTLPANLDLISGVDVNSFASTISICPAYGINNFCDLYICDGSGDENNTFLGPVRILCRLPNGPGTYQSWSQSETPAYECVNNAVVNYDNFIYSYYEGGDLSRETFIYPSIHGTIYGQQIILYARDDKNIGYISTCIISGNTKAISGVVNLTHSWNMFPQMWSADPATGNPWTASGVNDAEYGVELNSNSSGYCYVAQLAVETVCNILSVASLVSSSELGLITINARHSSAFLNNQSTMGSKGIVAYGASTQLVSSFTIDPVATIYHTYSTMASLNILSTLRLVADIVCIASSQLIYSSMLGVDAIMTYNASSRLITSSALNAKGGRTYKASTQLTSSSVLIAKGGRTYHALVSLVSSSGLGATAFFRRTLFCSSVLSATGTMTRDDSAHLISTSILIAAPIITSVSSGQLTSASVLIAKSIMNYECLTQLTSTSVLIAEATNIVSPPG